MQLRGLFAFIRFIVLAGPFPVGIPIGTGANKQGLTTVNRDIPIVKATGDALRHIFVPQVQLGISMLLRAFRPVDRMPAMRATYGTPGTSAVLRHIFVQQAQPGISMLLRVLRRAPTMATVPHLDIPLILPLRDAKGPLRVANPGNMSR